MKRATLKSILDQAEGIDSVDGGYEVADKHRVTFYIGEPGDAMVVSDIVRVRLSDDFVAVTSGDSGATTYCQDDSIQAISTRPPKPKQERRAGFA